MESGLVIKKPLIIVIISIFRYRSCFNINVIQTTECLLVGLLLIQLNKIINLLLRPDLHHKGYTFYLIINRSSLLYLYVIN